MQRFLFLFLLVVTAAGTSAQTPGRENYQLLWKISGPGVKSPSYLFGTMHVRDARAFDFSDSVLAKVDACKAFAMEVHPDSLMSSVLETLFGSAPPEDQLSKNLSPQEYKKLDSLTQLRTGTSLRKFKTPTEMSLYLIQRNLKKDSSAFLDAWLYAQARSQGKKILGLENPKDQLALLQDASPAMIADLTKALGQDTAVLKRWTNTLLDAYRSGDIALIDKLTHSQSGIQDALKLETRNEVMASRISTEAKRQSTFIAIGAAHLAGTKGVIELLRKKGFKLVPVKATFTGMAKKHRRGMIGESVVYQNEEDGYSLKMPIAPLTIKHPSMPVPLMVSWDLGSEAIMMSTSFGIPANLRQQGASATLDKLTAGFSERMQLVRQKAIQMGDYEGREALVRANEYSLSIRTILRDNRLYMLIAGASDSTALKRMAAPFFSSLRFLPMKVVTTGMERFSDAAGAFSVSMPGKVVPQVTTAPDDHRNRSMVFYSAGQQSGDVFLVRYNDITTGSVSVNDSIYVHQTVEMVARNLSGTDLTTRPTTIQGYAGYNYSLTSSDKSTRTNGVAFMRGNRFYMLMYLRPANAQVDQYEAFAQSFQLLPYEMPATKVVDFPGGVKLRVTEDFHKDSTLERTNEYVRYSFRDNYSGMSFVLQVEELSYYREESNVEKYFAKVVQDLKNENDSIMSGAALSGPAKGWTYRLQAPFVNNEKHIRLLLSGRKLISLWSFIPPGRENSKLPLAVAESLQATPESTWDLFADKTVTLLNDLRATDSTTYAAALAAIDQHRFKTEEIPLLYKAIEATYPDDRTAAVRSALLRELVYVHDATTSSFIQQLYQSLPDTTRQRDHALGVLVALKNEGDLKRVVQFINREESHLFTSGLVLPALYDSLQLLNVVGDEFLTLHNKFDNKYTLFDLYERALDSTVFETTQKDKVIRTVLRLANEFLSRPLATAGSDERYEQQADWRLMASLLRSVPFTSESKELLQKFTRLPDTEASFTAISFLLRNKAKVESAVINKVADDHWYRTSVVQLLKELGQLKQVDKKYLTKPMMAQGSLCDYLATEEDYPDQIELTGERTYLYKGVQRNFYLFKIGYDGYEETYVGLVGPYETGGKQQLDYPQATTVFYEPFESDAGLEERIAGYLKEKEVEEN
jgi:uncharacterized protein YbaP (TraB family)